jgi:hypothetical protein
MRALVLGIALALVGCADDGADVLAAGQTYTVLDVAADAAVVTYTVRTPDDVVRELRYDELGSVGVYDADGALVSGAGVVPPSLEDGMLAALDLPSHPEVGYAARGIDLPLPIATEAPDAVMPDGGELAYEAGCSRQGHEWTESDGCTYGVFIDTCENGTFWGSYQKKSGCAFLGWFCDCPGGRDGGQLDE